MYGMGDHVAAQHLHFAVQVSTDDGAKAFVKEFTVTEEEKLVVSELLIKAKIWR